MLTRTEGLRRAAAIVAATVALALAAGGCGSDDEARSKERPPVPVNISVLVGTDRVTVSPDEAGAGPVTFLVANQSGASQTLKIDGPRLERTVGPIPPEDTATVKATVQTGEFTLSVEDASGLRPATLAVGPPRPTAQNDLLLP